MLRLFVPQTNVLAALLAVAPERLVRLGSVDALIVILYFAMVIGIGFYLKRYATTSEDFFLAGRDMSSSNSAANVSTEARICGWLMRARLRL